MNTFFSSLAFGLAILAQTAGANAASIKQSDPESGCAADSYQDNSAVALSSSQDGLSLRRNDTMFSNLRENAKGVRLPYAAINDGEPGRPEPSEVGLERISSRVEKLGQGIVATPLVQRLIPDASIHSDATNEPKLSMILLAAAGVVAFVARRRRTI